MQKRSKILVGIAVVAVLALAAVLSVVRGRDRGIEVRMEVVERRDLVEIVTASGNIRALRAVDLSSDISAKVAELLVEEGEDVQRGQVLMRLDPALERAQVADRMHREGMLHDGIYLAFDNRSVRIDLAEATGFDDSGRGFGQGLGGEDHLGVLGAVRRDLERRWQRIGGEVLGQLRKALPHPAERLVDARIDPAGYPHVMRTTRG